VFHILFFLFFQHSKSTFEECFPTYVRYVAVPSLGTVFKGRNLALTALGSDAKKGYPKDCGAVEFEYVQPIVSSLRSARYSFRMVYDFRTKEEAVEYIIEEVSYINDAEAVTYQE
jgi:hypothetical protein